MKIKLLAVLQLLLLFSVPCWAGNYAEGEAIVVIAPVSVESPTVGKAQASIKPLARAQSQEQEDTILPGVEVIQRFRPVKAEEPETSVTGYGARTSSGEREYETLHVRSAEGETTEQLTERLKQLPGVISVTPNYIIEPDLVVPEDPKWGEQWAPAEISIPDVWTHTTGSEEIVVAVVDTGVAYYHEDLIDNMYVFDEESLLKMQESGLEIDPSEFIGSHGVSFIESFHPFDIILAFRPHRLSGTHCPEKDKPAHNKKKCSCFHGVLTVKFQTAQSYKQIQESAIISQ